MTATLTDAEQWLVERVLGPAALVEHRTEHHLDLDDLLEVALQDDDQLDAAARSRLRAALDDLFTPRPVSRVIKAAIASGQVDAATKARRLERARFAHLNRLEPAVVEWVDEALAHDPLAATWVMLRLDAAAKEAEREAEAAAAAAVQQRQVELLEQLAASAQPKSRAGRRPGEEPVIKRELERFIKEVYRGKLPPIEPGERQAFARKTAKQLRERGIKCTPDTIATYLRDYDYY